MFDSTVPLSMMTPQLIFQICSMTTFSTEVLYRTSLISLKPPSIFKVIRSTATLARILTTFVLRWVENEYRVVEVELVTGRFGKLNS